MFLGSSELVRLIHEEDLITNIDDYDFKIEGATIDVRLNKVFLHSGGGNLMLESRNTGDVSELLLNQKQDGRTYYNIFPNTVYLVNTIESVKMPNNIIAKIDTRSTLFRCGIDLRATYLNPGYSGTLTFMMINLTNLPIPIERGVRIAQIAFAEIKGTCEPYSGLWQNGKVHTNNQFESPR